MEASSANKILYVALFALILALQLHYRVSQIEVQHKTFSKIVIEQLKHAQDSIQALEKRSEVKDPEPERPSIVKDTWSQAASWVTFVQQASESTWAEFVKVYKQSEPPMDESLLTLGSRPLDERISWALRWCQTSDAVSRDKVMKAVLEVQSKPESKISSESKVTEQVKLVESKIAEKNISAESTIAEETNVHSESKFSDEVILVETVSKPEEVIDLVEPEESEVVHESKQEVKRGRRKQAKKSNESTDNLTL